VNVDTAHQGCHCLFKYQPRDENHFNPKIVYKTSNPSQDGWRMHVAAISQLFLAFTILQRFLN